MNLDVMTTDITNLELENLFVSAYRPLQEEDILKMQKTDISINNTVLGLTKRCFGMGFYEDSITSESNCIYYYIANKNGVFGDRVKIKIFDINRDYITFYFCKFLEDNYDDINIIDCFNSFQQTMRSFLEFNNYFTFSLSDELANSNPTLLIKNNDYKGILHIPHIEKESFYKKYFPKPELINETDKAQYVYLMLNLKTNLFKIGTSKSPHYREKTLCSEEPQIKTIYYWKGDNSVERNLHEKFKSKRVRGEWFRLKFEDLKYIKSITNSSSTV